MPGPPSFFHRHRAAVLSAVVLVPCAALLLAFEAFLAWRNPPPPNDTFRAIRLREHKPGLDEMIDMPDALLRDPESLRQATVHLKIDRDGFIEPSRVHDQADFTVAFVGGSTTECLWVQEQNRFPYVVGRLLEQSGQLGKKVNSFNAGRSANHSLHGTCAVLAKVIPLRPDVCVLMENCNDLMVLILHETYWDTHIAYRNLIEHKRRPTETAVTRFKDLVRALFPNLLELWSPVQVTDELAALRGRTADVDQAFIEAHFRKSLLTFVRLCQTWDVAPVLMTQANRITAEPDPQFAELPAKLKQDFGVDYAEFHRLYHRMNQVIRDLGAEHGVPVIDLAARIPQDRKYVYDPYHLNDAGSRLAAGIIAEELQQVARRR